MSDQQLGSAATGCVGLFILFMMGSCVFGGGDDEPAPTTVATAAPTQPVTPFVGPSPAQTAVEVKPLQSAAAYPVEACKAAVAVINGRDPATMTGRKLGGGIVNVSYRRADDGKLWQSRCEMIDDNHLRWAAFNAFGDGQQGRWRDEDTIKVWLEADVLHVDLDQSGVIQKSESYTLSKLS